MAFYDAYKLKQNQEYPWYQTMVITFQTNSVWSIFTIGVLAIPKAIQNI